MNNDARFDEAGGLVALVVAALLAMGVLCPPQAHGPGAGALLLEDAVGRAMRCR